MNRHGESKRTVLLKVCAVLFGTILLMSVVLFGVSWWERSQDDLQETTSSLKEEITHNGKTYTLREGITTLLVMGLDTFSEPSSGAASTSKQADFLALLVMDNQNKSCKVIQINRDTMVEMGVLGAAGDQVDTVTAQIALSPTYGNGREISCRNTVEAVKNLLGVDVMYYVSVSMDVVPLYNDMLGGVAVEILDDFTAIDRHMVQGTTMTLTGQQALTYVRARQGLEDSSNQHRMQRQRQYLQAVLAATEQRINKDAAFALSSIDKLSNYWTSNRTAEGLAEMVKHYRISNPEAFYTIEGTTKMGEQFLEFYPDEESLKEIVISCFYQLQE